MSLTPDAVRGYITEACHLKQAIDASDDAVFTTHLWRRINTIAVQLSDAVTDSADGYELDSAEHGIAIVVNAMYWGTLRTAPETLPQLLPVFLTACTEKHGAYIELEGLE